MINKCGCLYVDREKYIECFNELWEDGLSKLIVPKEYSSTYFLREVSLKALYNKYDCVTKEIKERWKREMDIICYCQTSWLYLLLWDFIYYTKKEDIMVSPGCASITGSLVAYVLGITDVDPIKYNLFMERFINKELLYPAGGYRIELEKGGKQLLSSYVEEKYGILMCLFLEKLDITFIDNDELSIVSETIKEIAKEKKKYIDVKKIDYNDESVFNLINTQGLMDTYWLIVMYNNDFVNEEKIVSLEDLMTRISMARPGLGERYAEYIMNKKNEEEIKYECPELEEILASTYGCIVYQEQIMQILISLGGFTFEQSKKVYCGLAKKSKLISVQGRHDFVYGNDENGISGCRGKGISEEVAEKIYDDMWIAACFAFNKAHAVSCAISIYRMAWLKYYYKEEYVTALEHLT